MNGVFRFKENVFLKYKKEIITVASVAILLTGMFQFISYEKSKENVSTTSVESQIAISGYDIFVDNNLLGTVKNKSEGQEAVAQAIELVIEELGYDPEVAQAITYKEIYSLENTYIEEEILAEALKDDLIQNLDRIKIKACVMKIGDDFTVAVEDQDAVKEVLANAQSIYVTSEDIKVDISLEKDQRNSLVITPLVIMQKEELGDRAFVTSDNMEEDIKLGLVTEESTDEDVEEIDRRSDGVTVAIEFAEEVLIVEGYAYEDDIKDISEATELITKEHAEAKMYKISTGDVPSIIAENNDMKLSDLYRLNPDLKGNERTMQVGAELVVMVPEPELSVTTKEEVVYTESIAKGVTYVENPDKYVGSNATTDEGYNGVLQITAIVSKLNGDETGREITDETVIKEAKDKVILKGVKPLPVKGATGNFISPLESYRITSYFGPRWGGFHYGVDLAVSTGATVRASDGGVITFSGWKSGYGYLVEINHGDGVRTRYGHNSKLSVKVGETVSQYQEIAKSGNTGRSTGPHVHFEIRFDGVCANPLNYMER